MKDESTDWVEKYRQGNLLGNMILCDTIQDLTRMIREYIEYIKKMEKIGRAHV